MLLDLGLGAQAGSGPRECWGPPGAPPPPSGRGVQAWHGSLQTAALDAGAARVTPRVTVSPLQGGGGWVCDGQLCPCSLPLPQEGRGQGLGHVACH